MKGWNGLRRSGEEGNALLIVIWVTLVLSTLHLAAHNRLSLDRIFYAEHDALVVARRRSRDLFHHVILYLQQDKTRYDTKEEMVFPVEELLDPGLSGAEVELWDEGSKLNPNNAPLPLLSAYFAGEAGCFDAVQNRLFGVDGEAAYGQVVRKDFFLSKAELNEVFLTGGKGKQGKAEFRQDLTVFSPAILGLLDGEVLVSLLLRWGEEYDQTTVLRIIDDFNRNRKDLISLGSFNELAARLHLDLVLETDDINDLLMMEGCLNPNLISARFLEALFKQKNNEVTYGFYDLDEFREQNPFIEKSVFEYYLQTLHNIPVTSEEIWKIFALETKIWGVRMRVPVSTGRLLETTAVLRRERDELMTKSRIRVLAYEEQTKINER